MLVSNWRDRSLGNEPNLKFHFAGEYLKTGAGSPCLMDALFVEVNPLHLFLYCSYKLHFQG
jgi:hypothetical protein